MIYKTLQVHAPTTACCDSMQLLNQTIGIDVFNTTESSPYAEFTDETSYRKPEIKDLMEFAGTKVSV